MTEETNPITNQSPITPPPQRNTIMQIRRWLKPPVFPDDAEKTRRAMMVNSILIAALFLGILFAISIPWSAGSWLQGLAIVAMVIAVVSVGLITLRRGNVASSITLLVTFGWLLTAGVSIFYGGLSGPIFPNFAIVILIAGLLLGYRPAAVFAVSSILYGSLLFYLETLGILEQLQVSPLTFFTRNAFIFIAISFIAFLTNNTIFAALRRADSSEKELKFDNQGLLEVQANLQAENEKVLHQLERRNHFHELASQIAHVTVSTNNLQDMIDQFTHLIADRFNYYQVGLFLIGDDAEWAILQSASSEGGREMIARNHRLGVGKQGIVGFVTGIGQPRITQDIDLDRIHSVTPELPETRSEMALPLKVRGEIIGALDIQDSIPNAFLDEDISALQTLADQICLAIENLRLAQQAANQEDRQQGYGEISQRTWAEAKRQRAVTAYKYADGAINPINDPNETIFAENKLEVPIIVRGNHIGSIEIARGGFADEWTEDEEMVLSTLSDQLGIALDSARLFNETQLRASTEKIIGDINSEIWESLEINSILRTTVEKLQQSLDLPEVSIKMTNPSAAQDLPNNGNPLDASESN
ncbi:MAG: GAF domain-containing protein [Chloroflexota bacterium]